MIPRRPSLTADLERKISFLSSIFLIFLCISFTFLLDLLHHIFLPPRRRHSSLIPCRPRALLRSLYAARTRLQERETLFMLCRSSFVLSKLFFLEVHAYHACLACALVLHIRPFFPMQTYSHAHVYVHKTYAHTYTHGHMHIYFPFPLADTCTARTSPSTTRPASVSVATSASAVTFSRWCGASWSPRIASLCVWSRALWSGRTLPRGRLCARSIATSRARCSSIPSSITA